MSEERIAELENRLHLIADYADWLAEGTPEQRLIHRALQKIFDLPPDQLTQPWW